MLGTQTAGLSESFAALFHCASGGMPPDVLRAARAAATQISPEQSSGLAKITS